MYMIDILRLPGVEQARDDFIDAHEGDCCELVVIQIDTGRLDDLIRAVAEAVERKVERG